MHKRSCPICGQKPYRTLFVQGFADGQKHNIVSCRNCDFVFVNNSLRQKEYDRYYEKMSKYEIERDKLLHEQYKNIIQKFCPNNVRILDVGSSIGHLLYLLKKAGFQNLLGLDPSAQCKTIAWSKFKIIVRTSTIASFKDDKKYDLVILAMVLEHLSDIKTSLSKVDKLVKEEGYIFISVPDTSTFYNNFEEAFGEFSVEHINFYSTKYLSLLMNGYSCVYLESKDNNILSLWKKTGSLKDSIAKYILLSEKKLSDIRRTINNAPPGILVWGAGSLTRRLFDTSELKDKTVKILDSDSKLWGKKIDGVEIVSPKYINKYDLPILIASYNFKKEILDYIKTKRIPNRVITLK